MRRLKLTGLVFIAALALGAMAAAPSFAALTAVEFSPGATGTAVTTASTGSVTLKNKTNTETVTCTADSSSGKLKNAHEIEKIVVHFTGCSAEKSGVTCGEARTLHGAVAKEIVTNELVGKLGLIASTEGASEVGIRLEPVGSTIFAELEIEKNTTNHLGTCVASTMAEGKITGEVPMASLNKSNGKGELIFAENAGLQKVKKFEGVATTLTAFGSTANALVTTESVSFPGEPLEDVKTTP